VIRLSNYFLLLLTSLWLSCQIKDSVSKEVKKPNILLILTDDQGWGDLSLNGNKLISTPNIDKMAADGAVMENFFVSPVCSPTRAEILTGRFSPRSGVYSTSAGGERIDLDEATIADILKSNGYATGAFGKWHSGMQYPYHPNGRGFDEFYGFCSGHWGNYFSPMHEHNGQITKGEGFITDDRSDKAIDFINDNRANPFFVYLPYNTPHSPMQVPDKWYKKFENIEISQKGSEADKENIEHTKAAFAMCENIDWNVGRIQLRIKELNLEENTIIIYLSDNGPNGHRWNGGMKGIKGSTDEGGVKSPLIIQWKNKIEAGLRIKKIASSIDLLPTISEYTSITKFTNKTLDGKSIAPLLDQNNEDWDERYVYNYWRGKLSIRSQRFRLDHNDLLYDMDNDVSQIQDVSNEYPIKKSKMIKAKEYYQNEVISELPKIDSRPFTLGHSDYDFTQIPARDGIAYGNIKRSNKWPNCSFFTNWIDINDKIIWNVSVEESGDYEVILYYTCAKENVGTTVSLTYGDATISRIIKEAQDPPLIGMENDRGDPRIESYVKEFKPINLGRIHLSRGSRELTLKAEEIIGDQSIDFRLMMFEKV